MVNLFQDFETRSLIDLKQRGLPVYSSHPSTEVLLLSYAFDRGPVELWEPHVGPPPQKLVNALKDPTVRKVAWNAAFEHDIWAKVLGVPTSYSEWFDVKVEASYLSLAGGLGDVCQILEMPENDAKIKEGDSLITLFSSPYRRVGEATIFGVAEPSFHDWSTRPAEWQRFREYCARDTEVERKLFYMFEPVAMEYLQSDKGWVLDRKINDAGVPVNLTRLQKALRMVEGSSDNPTFGSKEYLMKEFRGLTGLENPNSRDQLLPWLQKNGYPFMSLNKVLVRRALIMGIPQACKDALVLRLEAAKTSYSKFKAIADRVSEDGRQRDMFVYMGAARTGRWSGYGVQFQNLPRPLKAVEKNLDRALDLIDKEDAKTLVEEFVQPNEYTQKRTPSVIGAVSSCIRSMFQTSEDTTFLVCDLNAIENRVLGWLARCPAILDVYHKGLDPYLEFAANGMYKVSYDSLVEIVNGVHKPKNAEATEKRQVAKPAVLGAGYGLGHGTEIKNGTRVAKTHEDKWGNTAKEGLIAYAENMGVHLTPEESYLAVTSFRTRYPEVSAKPSRKNPNQEPGFWWSLENAANTVLAHGGTVRVNFVEFFRLKRPDGRYILVIKLPSGRCLHYFNARVEPRLRTDSKGEEHEGTAIVYDGIGHGVMATSDVGVWGPTFTYGGKLCENITQAVSRDVLLNAMLLVDARGGKIVAHVHDEIICEARVGDGLGFCYEDLKAAMTTAPEWAPGLPLAAEGYEGPIYRKG